MRTFRTIQRRATVDDGIQGPDVGARRPAAVRAAWMATVLLGVIAAFQAALVLGAPWGEFTQGGGTSGPLTTSGRIVAVVSCVMLMVMAGAILGRVGQGPFRLRSSRVKTVLAWFTTLYAVAGVVLNLITRSTGERALWAPVSILLLGLISFVMVTSHHNRVAHGD
jgi:hypothetical protein